MNIRRLLKPTLGVLACCYLAGASPTVPSQQKEQNDNEQVAVTKNACTSSDRAKFSVKCKARYFLGEAPTVTISIANTSRSPQTVKVAEYQKFSLEMTGLFEDASAQQKKNLVYDGSWDIPKKAATPPLPGEMHVFENLGKREPKFVKLESGESTTLELDLSKTFGSYLGVSKYKLTAKSEDEQKVVKEFEVYFDNEKSVPILAMMLESDDEAERNWAVSNLAQYSRPKLVTLLEQLARSGNEKQRDFAGGILAKLKAGYFGPERGAGNTKQSGQ